MSSWYHPCSVKCTTFGSLPAFSPNQPARYVPLYLHQLLLPWPLATPWNYFAIAETIHRRNYGWSALVYAQECVHCWSLEAKLGVEWKLATAGATGGMQLENKDGGNKWNPHDSWSLGERKPRVEDKGVPKQSDLRKTEAKRSAKMKKITPYFVISSCYRTNNTNLVLTWFAKIAPVMRSGPKSNWRRQLWNAKAV